MPTSISLPASMPASEAIKLLSRLKDYLELRATVNPVAQLGYFSNQICFNSYSAKLTAAEILNQTFIKYSFKSQHNTCFELSFYEWWNCPSISIQEALHVIGETIKELQSS